MRSQATPQAAPTQGAAPTATKQRRAALAATLARLDAAFPKPKPYPVGPPRSTNPLDDPATDPSRWEGFI